MIITKPVTIQAPRLSVEVRDDVYSSVLQFIICSKPDTSPDASLSHHCFR